MTGATGVNADGEVAALSASRAPFLIGVRHHSPALAVAVPRLLDGFGPDVLAVELPAQARAWVDWLAHPETVAPVALAFSRGEGMSFYPFADFSPELAALRWARGAGVEVACVDLPVGAGPGDGGAEAEAELSGGRPNPAGAQPGDSGPGGPGTAEAGPGDPRGRLALEERAGCGPGDAQETWDRLVEARAPASSPEQIRVAALANGWAMRADEGAVDARTAAREEWMRDCVATLVGSGRKVAALVGAFHAPALLEPGADGAGALPGTDEVRAALVGYSFEHLDSRSGYPSGIRDPGWRQLVLESGLDPAALESGAVGIITSITRALRAAGFPAGPGEAAETARLALDLAALRGLAAPSRRELIEAVTSVLAQGEVLGRGRAVADALEQVRTLLAYLPSSADQDAPRYDYDTTTRTADASAATRVGSLVPASSRQAYDVAEVVAALVDHGELVQVQEDFAPNVVIGFACFEGRPVGIVANQPLHDAGTLDVDASEKLARFVRFCDAFGLPVVTFVDVPGYRPGAQQEHAGIIRRGAKVINAYATATVPLVTVILRKAYGGAYIVMGSKAIGADFNFCWPGAEIAVLGAAGAVGIIHRRDLKAVRDERGEQAEAAERERLTQEYTRAVINPDKAVAIGEIDAVIAPEDTRTVIVDSLAALADKRDSRHTPTKKHDNVPL